MQLPQPCPSLGFSFGGIPGSVSQKTPQNMPKPRFHFVVAFLGRSRQKKAQEMTHTPCRGGVGECPGVEWRGVPCGVEWDFCKRTDNRQSTAQTARKRSLDSQKAGVLGSKSAALTTEKRGLSSTSLRLTRDNPGLTVGPAKARTGCAVCLMLGNFATDWEVWRMSVSGALAGTPRTMPAAQASDSVASSCVLPLQRMPWRL